MRIPYAWQPDPGVQARVCLTDFFLKCGEPDFHSLYRRSIEDVEWFTAELLRFLQIRCDPPYEKLLDMSDGPEWARWCVNGGLNISTPCLFGKGTHQTAVVWEGQQGINRSWSYRALRITVLKCAAGLRDLGIGKGDAVGVHLPMMPETVAILLALARIGAVAVPLFSGYGPGAIESRLLDVRAKLLVTANAFPRRGKVIASKQAADAAAARCPLIRHIVVVNRLEEVPCTMQPGRDLTWEELCSRGSDQSCEPTLATDLLLILYTSGTTGAPKGIVHDHCGFPVKAAADMAFLFDVRESTRIAWITDTGWMMGPWLIYGALLLGGVICLYDGAPDYPF